MQFFYMTYYLVGCTQKCACTIQKPPSLCVRLYFICIIDVVVVVVFVALATCSRWNVVRTCWSIFPIVCLRCWDSNCWIWEATWLTNWWVVTLPPLLPLYFPFTSFSPICFIFCDPRGFTFTWNWATEFSSIMNRPVSWSILLFYFSMVFSKYLRFLVFNFLHSQHSKISAISSYSPACSIITPFKILLNLVLAFRDEKVLAKTLFARI